MYNFLTKLSINNKGFSLVELMLVLALLGMTLAGAYQFFFFTHKSYASADANSQVIQEANLFINQIEREIRSASMPNDATPAVRILNNGEQIDIYLYHPATDSYERVSYRLNPNDKTQLQRGSVGAAASESVPGTSSNPQYGNISDDARDILVTNIGNLPLFTDVSNDQYVASERRHINIDLKILDPENNRPVSIQTSVMSRSGRTKTSVIAAGDITIPASNIVLYYSGTTNISFINTDSTAKNISIIARVEPLAATDRSITWSKNQSWITLAHNTTKSGDVQNIQIAKNEGAWVGWWPFQRWEPAQTREVTIVVKNPATSGVSTILKIRQDGEG